MILTLLFISTMAQATMPRLEKPDVQKPVNLCVPEKIDFKPALEAAAELKLPLNMLAAVPKITFPMSRCSSSVVSDDGTLLTSGHCLEECFKSAGIYVKENGLEKVNKAALANLRCPIEIDGVRRNAKILATNLCPSTTWGSSPEALKACTMTDYALLQVDGPPLDLPCLFVSERPAGPGQSVVALGYPKKSVRQKHRQNAKDSDGVSQYLSDGKVLRPELECFQRVSDPQGRAAYELDRKGLPETEYFREVMRQVKSGVVLQASADILQGNSGGILAGRYTGKVVGVSSFFHSTYHSDEKECEGAAFFTSSRQILDHIRAHFPAAVAALNCDKKSVLK